MAEKVKAKVKRYGKKSSRVVDLTSDFAGLLVSDSPEQPQQTNAPPPLPLQEVSGNPRSPRPQRRRAPQVTPSRNDAVSGDQLQYCRPLLEASGNKEIDRFDQWAKEVEPLLTVTKIGDGSYADVFKFATKDNPSTNYVIAKLIPLKPKTAGLDWGDMTSVEDALTELRLLELVTEVPGFVEFRGAKVLYGTPPELISRPTQYFNQKRKHFNVKTDYRGGRNTYAADQLWLLIEMSDAGSDLDSLLEQGKTNGPLPLIRIPSDKETPEEWHLDIRQARDLFWSAASSLAHGEQHARFEHRDLHLSNICVKRNPEATADHTYSFVPRSSQLEVVLIDYTLSRAGTGEQTIHNPMADKEIFKGSGDLQFETYRHMRKAVKVGRGERWEEFVPLTNVLWLHHLLVKLMGKTHEPENDEAQELWDAMGRLCDSTSPKKMMKRWDYLSAGDLVAMGKTGKRVFVDGVLEAIGGKEAGMDDGEDGLVMQKAKAERYKRLKRESMLSPEEIPLPD